MKSQIRRILHDRIKMTLVVILLLLPSLEVAQILYEHFKYGFELPYPLYATFLSLYSRGHVLQSLYLWFLPLYYLIIVGDDCIEDYDTGYKNLLTCRMGKKKYIKTKLSSAFLIPFFIMLSGLLINFIIVKVVCANGTYLQFGGDYMVYDSKNMPETLLFELSYTHPLITNFVYMLVTSFFSGLICIVGTLLSIVLHNRKLVYALTFALWFGPVLPQNSFMFVLQPFMEYGFNVVVPLFIWIAGLYLQTAVLLYIWEAKFVEI